jgi:hypothetical protein
MTNGAIDNDFDVAEQGAEEVLQEAVADLPTEPYGGSIVFDLVTRQPLYVRSIAAASVVKHYEQEGFDLASYGVHPYLPVSPSDTVYECVFLSDITADSLAAFGDAKTYDFPRGRLAHVPVELAGDGDA